MANPADELAQANEDVERIARETYETFRSASSWGSAIPSWEEQVDDPIRDSYRAVVRILIRRRVIRVGDRPSVERPMEGQISIEEDCEHTWEVGSDLCAYGCGARFSELHPEATDG